ncbi:V-type ATP synthase subunit D [Streptomyces mirabilis]|uniref:V-type ATP synthase subunit D n=1 Tax=Streptomyces mirabilis TaxID=68239 RepID=UPI0036592CFE
MVHAEAAYRQAVRAATDHACARAAARIVGAEMASTSRRVRALRRHWIPRPQEALAHVDLAPEQSEHEDSVRRRWAAQVLKGTERQTERDGPSEDRSARR